MGSRIAVLNAGIIQQLGPPQELYDHPTNLFVAGFIGSPSMNFFPDAKVSTDGDTTKLLLGDVGQVTVPPLYVEQTKAATGKNLTFGIRPEHLEDITLIPQEEQSGSNIDAVVEVVENLGSELQAYVTAGGRSITARLDPRSKVHTGSNVRLHVENDNIHLFDTDSGVAIY